MNETKKVILKVGVKGWFETPLNNADVFEIVQDTLVEIEQMGGNRFWWRSIGHVDGFPNNHPTLLINYKDVEKALGENNYELART